MARYAPKQMSLSNSGAKCGIEIAWQKYYTAKVMLAVYGSGESDDHTIMGLSHYLNVRTPKKKKKERILQRTTSNATYGYRPRSLLRHGWPVQCASGARMSDVLSMEPTLSRGVVSFSAARRSSGYSPST